MVALNTEADGRRDKLLRLNAMLHEMRLREERKRQAGRGGLLHFVRYFWHILEPSTKFVEGWALEAICEHLEAVTRGEINRLLINVPPGFMKSLMVDVFWPAWEWGPCEMPHLRYVAFSYSVQLTERDNGRFRDLILSTEYQEMWGHAFKPRKVGETKVSNSVTGFKLATSIEGVSTGERGNRVILDDPHNIKEAESEAVRTETVRWFKEGMLNRLNDIEADAIVVVMQRVHEADVSGAILTGAMDYVHLMIPMEFDPGRRCETDIGWSDPREDEGELAWPGRFPAHVVEQLQNDLGPYAYNGQYQQAPTPRGGGIFKRDWWGLWEDPNNKFPPFEFVLASADTAYTEKETNDPSALTIWGVYRDALGAPKIMLMHAWRKFLELHGPESAREPGETEEAFNRRTQTDWGLCEWLAYSCRRYKVDLLLIEAKATGITVSQELRRLHVGESWAIQLVTPIGDKVSRAHAVQPVFSQRLVSAPDREWADLVIDEMQSFPRGRYRDLTDSATQALKHLRESGLITHRSERAYQEDQAARNYGGKPEPLYPV